MDAHDQLQARVDNAVSQLWQEMAASKNLSGVVSSVGEIAVEKTPDGVVVKFIVPVKPKKSSKPLKEMDES